MPEAPRSRLVQPLIIVLCISGSAALVAFWLRDEYAFKLANIVMDVSVATILVYAIRAVRSSGEIYFLGWRRIYRDKDPILWVATLGAWGLLVMFLTWMAISTLLSLV